MTTFFPVGFVVARTEQNFVNERPINLGGLTAFVCAAYSPASADIHVNWVMKNDEVGTKIAHSTHFRFPKQF